MIIMGNELGALGWGMVARIVGSPPQSEHALPPMVYQYVHKFQESMVYDPETFIPLAYSDVTSNTNNIVWHFNNWEKLKELKVVSVYQDNNFDNVEIYKVFKKLAKTINKLTSSKHAEYKERLSLLLMLNNFIYSPEIDMFCNMDEEKIIKLVKIMHSLRSTSASEVSIASSAGKYLELPDLYLDGMLR